MEPLILENEKIEIIVTLNTSNNYGRLDLISFSYNVQDKENKPNDLCEAIRNTTIAIEKTSLTLYNFYSFKCPWVSESLIKSFEDFLEKISKENNNSTKINNVISNKKYVGDKQIILSKFITIAFLQIVNYFCYGYNGKSIKNNEVLIQCTLDLKHFTDNGYNNKLLKTYLKKLGIVGLVFSENQLLSKEGEKGIYFVNINNLKKIVEINSSSPLVIFLKV